MKAQEVIDYLAKIHALDPVALQAVFDCRVPCNTALENAPDDLPVVIGGSVGAGTLGALGLINGLCDEKIAAMYSEPDADGKKHIVGFGLASEFQKIQNPA